MYILRRILGGKGNSSTEGSVASTSSGKVEASTANDNGKSSTVEPEVAKAPITPSESIWNSAYDALKADEPKLVQAYEKILSLKLNQSAASVEPENVENTIENENVLVRRAQMHQLINDDLNKPIREASIKNSIGTVMQVVNTTKKLVSDAIKDMPQAALPWVIVYISLSILANPISHTEANQTGIEYIGITIKWYWEQASLLFDGSSKDSSFTGVQNELQMAFIDFYKKLLQFQMKSICNYYRHRGFVFLRDLVELDNWDGSLKSIQTDDTSLRNKITAFLSLESESHFRAIARHTKAQETYQRTQEDQQCLRDLRITDPRDDRNRIENTKGGLLQESYRWILENPQFQTWRSNDDNRLLWLRGDPGKGKTMLLCGLAQELMQQANPSLVTFFFCQATIPSVNNHIAVLRGLIWLLADQQPSLISYIRKIYDTAGKSIFDEGNAWYALSEIFNNMLRDEGLPPVYIIIDALDECTTGRMELLHLIRDVSISSNAKWVVSSRNWPEIEEKLIEEMSLSLEVNATLVASAVDAYISHKASKISLLKQDDNLKEAICRQIREKANGTFLWVAIVFERLSSESNAYYDDTSDAMAILDEMPEDLTKLYTVMLERISQLKGKGPELCRTILAIATLAYRPLHLNELSTLAGFQSNLKKLPQLNMLIKDCGSFLTVRDNHIYFVHQSAKEYLASDLSSQPVVFRHGMGDIKYSMVLNSLNAMDHTLRENIYGLEHPGILLQDVSPPNPNPLDHCLYSCTHWVAHLCDIYGVTDDQALLVVEEEILHFLKKHMLHWLEVLALTRNLSTNITYVQRLNELLKKRSTAEEIQKFVFDASRFMKSNVHIMEIAPMQIYSSPLLFGPIRSLVCIQFSSKLSWIRHACQSVNDSHWSPRLQIIESRQPEAMCSSGTNLLVLRSSSKNVEIWDMSTGRQVHALNHTEVVQQAVFASDFSRVLTVAGDRFYCWDANSGAMIRNARIRGFDKEMVYSISNNGKFMASYKGYSMDDDGRVHIYHVVDGTTLQLSNVDATHSMGALKWSNDSNLLAVTTGYTTRIWEVPSGKEKLELVTQDGNIRGMPSFSYDSKLIAFPAGKGLEVWDLDTEEKVLNVSAGDSWEVEIVEFSKDSSLIAETHSHRDDNGLSHHNISIWEISSRMEQHEFRIGSEPITGMTWSDDGQTLVVAFSKNIETYDLTEQGFWDFKDYDKPSSYQIQSSPVLMGFSPDLELVATAETYLGTWDTTTGYLTQAFHIDTRHTFGLQFSQDAKFIYSYSEVNGLQKWDIVYGGLIHTFSTSAARGRRGGIAFSFDGNCFASESKAGDEILLWNLNTAEEISHSMTYHDKGINNMRLLALSQNAKHLVSAEYLATANHSVSKFTPYRFIIWNVESGEELWAINVDIGTYVGNVSCEACTLWLNREESMVISNDGNTVLFTERARHGMWILTRGGEKIRLQICCLYFNPSFDMESSDTHILTQLGRIALDNLIDQAENLTGSEVAYDYRLIVEGYGGSQNQFDPAISSTHAYIRCNTADLKIFKTLVGKFHDKPGSLRGSAVAGISSDTSTLDDEKISPATDAQRENAEARWERHEDQNSPPATVNRRPVEQEEISEQNCLSFNATLTQPEVAEAPTTPPENLWNSAYDKLEAEEPKLVEEFELILSYHLNSKNAYSLVVTSTFESVPFLNLTGEKNMIEKENTRMRRAQMYRLVNDGLNKAIPEANIKESTPQAVQVANTTKRLVSDALQGTPQAALPWAVVFVSLDTLRQPPASRIKAKYKCNPKNVEYCASTVKWYSEQASLLFDERQNYEVFIRARFELQTALVDFYKELLRYQMKSVCDHYRRRGFVFLRDIYLSRPLVLELDGWDGSLRSIQADDASLRKTIHALLSLEPEPNQGD